MDEPGLTLAANGNHPLLPEPTGNPIDAFASCLCCLVIVRHELFAGLTGASAAIFRHRGSTRHRPLRREGPGREPGWPCELTRDNANL